MNAINDIPKDHFRVVQPKRDEVVLIGDCDCPVKAFGIADQHNRALGVDEMPRTPYAVFHGKDQVFG